MRRGDSSSVNQLVRVGFLLRRRFPGMAVGNEVLRYTVSRDVARRLRESYIDAGEDSAEQVDVFRLYLQSVGLTVVQLMEAGRLDFAIEQFNKLVLDGEALPVQ